MPDISPLMPMHQDPLLVHHVIVTEIFRVASLALLGYVSGLIPRECLLSATTIHSISNISKIWIWSLDWTKSQHSPDMSKLVQGNRLIFQGAGNLRGSRAYMEMLYHDNVIKWKHFPRYCPFVRGIHRLPVDSPHKGQWRRALMFSLICAWTNGWVNNRDAGDLKRHRAHYDVNVMTTVMGIGYRVGIKFISQHLLWNTPWNAVIFIMKYISSGNDKGNDDIIRKYEFSIEYS